MEESEFEIGKIHDHRIELVQIDSIPESQSGILLSSYEEKNKIDSQDYII